MGLLKWNLLNLVFWTCTATKFLLNIHCVSHIQGWRIVVFFLPTGFHFSQWQAKLNLDLSDRGLIYFECLMSILRLSSKVLLRMISLWALFTYGTFLFSLQNSLKLNCTWEKSLLSKIIIALLKTAFLFFRNV